MMLKSELEAKLAAAYPVLSHAVAERVVRTVFDTIAAQLSEGGRVELRGFGVFSVKERRAKKGRNPRTGAEISIEAKTVPFFRTGKELHRRLNPE
jgi:integration host factor subunit beta